MRTYDNGLGVSPERNVTAMPTTIEAAIGQSLKPTHSFPVLPSHRKRITPEATAVRMPAKTPYQSVF